MRAGLGGREAFGLPRVGQPAEGLRAHGPLPRTGLQFETRTCGLLKPF